MKTGLFVALILLGLNSANASTCVLELSDTSFESMESCDGGQAAVIDVTKGLSAKSKALSLLEQRGYSLKQCVFSDQSAKMTCIFQK